MYVFSVENASSHLTSQWKAFFRTWKNGRNLSLDLDIKWLREAILPVKRLISLVFEGGCMSSMTFILYGFASIPQLLTMKPKNFSAETLKAHLVGFNFML